MLLENIYSAGVTHDNLRSFIVQATTGVSVFRKKFLPRYRWQEMAEGVRPWPSIGRTGGRFL
jgi:hypothetical protein